MDKEKAQEKEQEKQEKEVEQKTEAVKDYYEAESWQFSGCGD